MRILVLGRVVRSQMLQTVRAVGALTLFVAGALAGVVLREALGRRRAPGSTAAG